MSTATAAATAHERSATTASDHRVTFPHLVRAEWIKFWSLRSTIWTLSITVVVMVGLVALVTGTTPPEFADESLGLVALTPAAYMGSLAVVVLGVLTITGEYTTGMIRSSLTAAPRRTPVLAAKATVLTVAILVVTVVAVALSYAVELLILGDDAPDLAASETQRVLAGAVLYTVAIALFAFAIGALLRHSAAAMATVLGLLLVVENVISFVSWKPFQYIAPFLPSSAGGRLLQPDDANEAMNLANDVGADLTAWQGFGVLVAWVVVTYAVAAVLLRRRDA